MLVSCLGVVVKTSMGGGELDFVGLDFLVYEEAGEIVGVLDLVGV